MRTSSIGEFFARLQMLRSFAAQLSTGAVPSCEEDARDGDGASRVAVLATVSQGLWQYYSQVKEKSLKLKMVDLTYQSRPPFGDAL